MKWLFKMPNVKIATPREPKGCCKDCKHRQRWQCGGRIIQYCGVTRSNRTFNKLKKIKVYMGCELWEALDGKEGRDGI